MEQVKITGEFIKLDQLLKWVNVVSNGRRSKVCYLRRIS